VPLVLLLLAVALHLARRPSGGEGSAEPPRARPAGLWRRILLPGFAAVASGEGFRGFLSLLLPAALVMLPLFGTLGYRLPWGYDPGRSTGWIVTILGLSLYLGVRLRTELRNEL
jgi:hypothetical protein